MNKSFSVLKTNIGNMVSDTSSSFATKIGVWINNRYRDILSRYEWEELLHNFSLTASATVSGYKLDMDLDRIEFILDATNDSYLTELGEQEFYQQYYDVFDDTGTPERFFQKYDVVNSQPTSAEKLTFKSSSASDTTQSILLRGIANSVEIYESINLSGATVASATNSYTRVLGISKSAATTGRISAMLNDAATVISLMPPETLESRYKQIHLHPIPTGTVIYHIKAIRKILPLAQDYDYPILDIADTIELGAEADAERAKRQFGKAQQFELLYEKSLSEKIFQRLNQPGHIIQFIPTPLNRDNGIL